MTLAITSEAIDGKSARDRLVEGEQLLSAYSNGRPVSALIEEFGLSRATIYRRLQLAVDARLAPTVDEYRASQNVVLDEQMERANQHLASAGAMMTLGTEQEDIDAIERGLVHHLKAMEMVNRICEARRRLNGLDMPVKVEATVHQVSQQDVELAEMIREAKARAAHVPGTAPR